MTCTLCDRKNKNNELVLCERCITRLRERLADLPKLRDESGLCLSPSKSSGLGVGGSEPTMGINLNALDYVTGSSILGILHSWEKVIREDRQLTPPALVPRYPDEVLQSVKFHLSHLDWTVEQPWVDEFAREVASIHAQGCIAARRDRDQVKRIPCPVESDGQPCGYMLAFKSDDMLEQVICKRCDSSWTMARLVSVSMSTPSAEIWLDAEAIAQWCNISERQVRRLVKSNDLPKRGQLVELNAFIEMRKRIGVSFA